MASRKGGYVLLEATIATMLLSTAMVALVPTFLLSRRAEGLATRVRIGTLLSSALLEEIRSRRWDEKTPLPVQVIALGSNPLGLDSGEIATDKRTFDDIDDFSGWTEPEPLDPMQQPLSGFTAYARSVTVQYVNAALSASVTPTDYKTVRVCTQRSGDAPLCLSTLLTNH